MRTIFEEFKEKAGQDFNEEIIIEKLKDAILVTLRLFASKHFSYLKKDGSVREADGTLHPDVIEKYTKFSSEGTSKPKPNYLVTYFDLGAMAWRSFNIKHLIEVSSINWNNVFEDMIKGC